MPLKIVRNDITKMQVDAIVNTANSEPIYSTGVDTAVYETSFRYLPAISALSDCTEGTDECGRVQSRLCYQAALLKD